MFNKIYSSISYISKNTLPDDDLYGEMFCVSKKINGKLGIIDLKPNGRNIKVTDENKEEFVKLLYPPNPFPPNNLL